MSITTILLNTILLLLLVFDTLLTTSYQQQQNQQQIIFNAPNLISLQKINHKNEHCNFSSSSLLHRRTTCSERQRSSLNIGLIDEEKNNLILINNDSNNKKNNRKLVPFENLEREETPAKPSYTCFGKGYNVPTVCSGNGVCSSQDVCDCQSPYVGLNCDVNPSTTINRSWFNLQVDSSVLLLKQTNLDAWVDVSKLAQDKFSDLIFRFGLYNSSGLIAERLESNISSWSVGAATFELGDYFVNATVFETKYNYTKLFNARFDFMVLDLNSLSVSDLNYLSTRNLRDITENMGKKNKTEIKNIVKEASNRSIKSIFEAKDVSTIYLISSYENRNSTDEELSLLVGAGVSNLTATLLDQVKANIFNESFFVEGVLNDCFNISSNLLSVPVISDSNRHESNIQTTLMEAVSTLSLIRSDRKLVRVALELFEVTVTNQTSFTSGVSISIPDYVKNIGNDVSFGVINYNIGVWFSNENNTNPNITSISNVMSFKTFIGGNYVPLSGLPNALEFVFNTQNVDTVSLAGFNESLYSKNVSCRYWNTATKVWDNYGCSAVVLGNYQVQCRCDHTTSFSAFLEYIPISQLVSPGTNLKKISAIDSGLMIVKIVISSLFLISICAVVVGLIIFRNKQPVKSRHFFPYIGLASLFIWLAFTIASNGAKLGSSPPQGPSSSSPTSIVNNIQVVVTSSLVSISVCCYLFVCLRYMFYRYYYQWMTFVDSKNKGSIGRKWIHTLKSNAFLFGLLAIIGVIIALYFVLLVILRATEVFDARQYSLAGSISHFLIMISLMACVITVFVVDLRLDFRSKQISDEMCDISDEITSMENETTGGTATESSTIEISTKNQVHKLKNLFGKNTTPSKIYHYWITNDRLLFRVDAVIFSIGMLFFIASYIVGFRSLDFRYNTGLTEAQVYQLLTLDSLSYTFEILMTCCFIAVYGGVAVVASLYSKYATSKIKVMETRIRNSKTEFAEIYSLIESQHLMKIFKAFCKSEFSLENLSLWLRTFQAKKYQEMWVNNSEESIKTWPDFKKEVLEWKYLYIQNGSPMTVNISARTRVSFEHWCTQIEVLDFDSIDKNELSSIMDNLEIELIYNLLDTYSRFHISEPFKIIKNCTEGRETFSGGMFKGL